MCECSYCTIKGTRLYIFQRIRSKHHERIEFFLATVETDEINSAYSRYSLQILSKNKQVSTRPYAKAVGNNNGRNEKHYDLP